MINARQRLVWAGLLAGAAFAASAQMPPPAAPDGAAPRTERMERMRDRMQQRHAEHMAEIKGKLQLSAAQEGAWNTFAAAQQPPAAPTARPDRAAIEKMTTPQRLDLMQSRIAERNAAFTRRSEATRAFYATLTPAQQKTFDAETLRMMSRHGGPGSHDGHEHKGGKH